MKTAGTCFVGFLPYTIMMVCVLFDVELGVWAIPIPLGSAFIPILAPTAMFCKVDAYRSSLMAILSETYHHYSTKSAAKSGRQPIHAWPTK